MPIVSVVTITELLEVVKNLVENAGCADPDCCAVSRAHDKALKEGQALLARHAVYVEQLEDNY